MDNQVLSSRSAPLLAYIGLNDIGDLRAGAISIYRFVEAFLTQLFAQEANLVANDFVDKASKADQFKQEIEIIALELLQNVACYSSLNYGELLAYRHDGELYLQSSNPISRGRQLDFKQWLSTIKSSDYHHVWQQQIMGNYENNAGKYTSRLGLIAMLKDLPISLDVAFRSVKSECQVLVTICYHRFSFPVKANR